MLNKEQRAFISEWLDRAEKLGIMQSNNATAFVDLEKPTVHYNFWIDDMLKADDFNFAHDFVHIQNDINRKTGSLAECFCQDLREGSKMFSDKRYAPILAELEGVAMRLGTDVSEVEDAIFRKVEERYHLEDIKTWYEDHTNRYCSDKMAKAILKEFEYGEDSNVDYWTNIENAYERVLKKRRHK